MTDVDLYPADREPTDKDFAQFERDYAASDAVVEMLDDDDFEWVTTTVPYGDTWADYDSGEVKPGAIAHLAERLWAEGDVVWGEDGKLVLR